MRKKWIAVLPFILMPVLIIPYQLLDSLLLVDIFGCGCVPYTQTNILNIPFNANDLRLTVFGILAVGMAVWSVFIAKRFQKRIMKWVYCLAVSLANVLLALWVVKTFMWA